MNRVLSFRQETNLKLGDCGGSPSYRAGIDRAQGAGRHTAWSVTKKHFRDEKRFACQIPLSTGQVQH